MSLPHTLQVLQMRHQDKIDSIEDERATGDGYWLHLKPGFIFDNDTHVIHEDTVATMVRSFRRVTPCDCEECRSLLDRARQREAQPASA